MSQCKHPAGKCNQPDDCSRRICAAPLDSYPQGEAAFFYFWYSHIDGDVMQPPLADVTNAQARYIWNAALKSKEQQQ